MIQEDNLKLASYVLPDGSQERPSGIPRAVADAVVNTVNDRRISNKIDVNKHWDFYQGTHAKYFTKRPSEPNSIFQQRKTNCVKPNYCEFIVNLGAKYLYGKPEGIRRKFSSEGKKNKTEDRLRHLEYLNKIPTFMLYAKKMAGVFGESLVRFIPVDERTGRQVETITESTFPRAIHLDARFTFPLLNAWGELSAIVVKDTVRDYISGIDKVITELVVPDSRWVWEDETLVKSEKNQWALDEEFVVLQNNDTGKDDIQSILNLQVKLDEALTDAAHFFEKHGWPQLVTRIDLSQVIKHPGYIWEVSTESDGKVLDEIDFLTWDGKMKEARQYAQDLESYILKMSSTAKMATGDLEAIGQLRSGAAIVAAHGPSIQKAEERQVVWRTNEIGLFTSMAKMDARLHKASVPNRFPDLKVDITYSDEFVPGEELIRAEINSMEMNSHTTTIRDVQRRKFPTSTEEEIEAKRKEIIEDSEDLTDSKRAFVTEQKQPVQSSEQKSNQQK